MISPADRPFELLKLIRDGLITHISELRRADPSSYYLTNPVVENLVKIGLVAQSAEGDLAPTPRLKRFFAGLGVSLSKLSPFTSKAVIASPIFGAPVTPLVKADVLVLMPFSDKLRIVYQDHIKTLL